MGLSRLECLLILGFLYRDVGLTINYKDISNNNTNNDSSNKDCVKYPSSTLCLVDVSDTAIIPDKTEKETIINMHNDIRRNVTPVADKMMKVRWDNEIAEVALKWAKQCTFEHDTHAARVVNGYFGIGQNLLAGSHQPTWEFVVNRWHIEAKDFVYGNSTAKMVGHYTQQIYWDTSLIGCGGAYCPDSNYKYIYVCNYFDGQYNVITPYPVSNAKTALSKCPDTQKDGLCDCGGKACKYGGLLDVNTCKCQCEQISSGEFCENIDCKPDWEHCGYYENNYCSRDFGMDLAKRCPEMCGYCNS